MAEDTKVKKSFSKQDLTEDQRVAYDWFEKRIGQLQKHRKSHYGTNLDELWAEADKNCVPHRLKTAGKKVVAEDETRGWRGALVTIGDTNWQSDASQSNAFTKIQVALSILIDRNPSGVFTAASKKFKAATELIKQLYEDSWGKNSSKAQLKLFVYNLAKYGWAVARTYPDAKRKYCIKRENLDPRNVWMDDMARPNSPDSVDDWAWRKVYTVDKAKAEFANSKWVDYIQAGGNTQDVIEANTKGKEFESEDLVEVYFYESVSKNLFYVKVGSTPVVISQLPITEGDKDETPKLSLWQTYWNLRHAESPYGVGIYEAIRYDNAFLDRIRNMTVDQIVMSIYKMFFYQGTQSLAETGDIKITPGVGKQVLNPKDINWVDIPGPGKDAYEGIQMFRKDLDEASGITDPLMGVITGKTAFETAQAKESALGRIRTPLDNILEALDQEGYITVSLMQLLYSIPEVYEISDPELIEAYLQEVGFNDELFSRSTEINEETGEAETKFSAIVYPEFALNLETDEQGNLSQTEDAEFFRIKPKYLDWQGVIHIKAESLLTPSKQVNKALELEMYNLLIPLLVQPPEIYQKVAKEICKLYDKDPKDILPAMWLMDPAELKMMQQQQQPLFLDQAGQQPGGGAETLIPSTTPPANSQNVISKISGKVTAPFR